MFKINALNKQLNICKNYSSQLDVSIKNFINQYDRIVFTDDYNEKIGWLPDTVMEIIFEVDYEYPLDNLPSGLIKLVLMFECNQKWIIYR